MANVLNDMAKLAIKGHSTKSDEVIEILEVLGGRKAGYSGRGSQYYYYIDNFGNIIGTTELPNYIIFKVFTLEEFIEKFPYKVGDKVKTIYEKIGIINKPIWSNRDNCIRYELKADTDSFYFVNELQPYKEEVMEEKGTLVEIDLTKELKVADEVEVILGDYEFVLKDGRTYFVKKKPKYPKTYEECCKVLLLKPERATYSVSGLEYKRHLIVNFQRLLICRDAYWKIAGDWKPNWEDGSTTKYTISCVKNKIELRKAHEYTYTLDFPTEEMRDAFYENFKKLIEECKELL